MIDVFKRLFKTAQAEANAALDEFQDPIKMSEQAIRDLKKDLENSLKALAEVKAINIGNVKRMTESTETAKDYEKKAMLLLQKAKDGSLEISEAERLATEALNKKESAAAEAVNLNSQIKSQEQMIANLEVKIKQLRAQINKWESEMKILKARAKTATATKKINKQMAGIDSDSTISMLEKMKEKVSEEEALAEAYNDVAGIETSVDQEIDAVIGGGKSKEVSDSLEEMKAKLGIK